MADDDSVIILDRAARELGPLKAYVLSLVARSSQTDPPTGFNLTQAAKLTGWTRATLRSVLKSLESYIIDLTPELSNSPHLYILTERGKQLTVSGKVVTHKKGKQPPAQPEQQTALLKHEDQMNLGALDIQAHQHLTTLGIRSDIRQAFKTAPDLVKKYTPAQILILHDPDGAIAANLATWRAAVDAGAEIKDKPALIWTRIVEGQSPPAPPVSLFTALELPDPTPEPPADSELDLLWIKLLAQIRLQTTRATYENLLKDTRLIARDGLLFTVAVKDDLSGQWLEHRLYQPIKHLLAGLVSPGETTDLADIQINFVTEGLSHHEN